jgi:hypothetical protein
MASGAGSPAELAALRDVSAAIGELCHTMKTMNDVVVALNVKVRSVEKKLGLLYTPFQARGALRCQSR